MNDFESAKWNHPSMKNRIDAEIAMMEASLQDDAREEPPAHKRAKRGGRRKPRSFGMMWRY